VQTVAEAGDSDGIEAADPPGASDATMSSLA
jgi:hypothetical protein